jgi:dTDP-4-dehydrorhamnose 3,5-epimerase
MGDGMIEREHIEGVMVTPLKIINVPGGDVLHAMKSSDPGYDGFGEAYFSTVELGATKAWKRHQKMTLNLVVPVGSVRFILFDDRSNASSYGWFQQVELSKEHYCRLTIPPMIWVGFQGIYDGVSTLLNIANIQHQVDEVDRKEMKEIEFDWELNL